MPGFLVWQSLPPISCTITARGTTGSGQSYVDLTVQDTRLGVKAIALKRATNATVTVPVFPTGTQDQVVVRATTIDRSADASASLKITDLYGNVSSCEGRIPAQP